MRRLRAATLVTPDPDAAMARYAKWLDYRPIERGTIDRDLANAWGAPATAGKVYVISQPASGAPVYLRFVEGTAPESYRPLRTYGWAAIEISVQDTLAVHARLSDSPFQIIGPPRELDGMPQIYPMQIKGPDDEIVFLTQIRGNLPHCDLPMAEAPIDRPFIIVLACSDLAASLDWFERVTGIASGEVFHIRYTMLSVAFGLPPEHKHAIATPLDGRDSFLELDQYPAAATPRPRQPDALAPGIALTTLLQPALHNLKADWITPPKRRDGAIYGGAVTGTLRAPDDTLLELVEMHP
jgi:catechol 2,3-dioxygenase-like lactoylglutathione lyase family enzyme